MTKADHRRDKRRKHRIAPLNCATVQVPIRKERGLMVARRHHFLPQCYLKGFSRSRKQGKAHQVVVFDRDGKSFTSSIINIAVKHDFNRVEIDGHAPDVFEQVMADVSLLLHSMNPSSRQSE